MLIIVKRAAKKFHWDRARQARKAGKARKGRAGAGGSSQEAALRPFDKLRTGRQRGPSSRKGGQVLR